MTSSSLPQPPAVTSPRACRAAAGWVLLVLVAGCSPGGPSLGTVSGTVTLDGQPLPNAAVEFHPEGGLPSYGRTGQDGTYTLQFSRSQNGAVVGHHAVRITTADIDDKTDRKIPERVAAEFNTQTTLSADVISGKNEFNFDVKARPAK